MEHSDIVFVSYGETNADKNWHTLKKIRPHAKRVENIRGISNAYLTAAQIAQTPHFYLIDADNELLPDFTFNFQPFGDYKTFIFRAKNPVNNLEYGYGGIKLYHRESLINYQPLNSNLKSYDLMSTFDFPAPNPIKFLPDVASITLFNCSTYDAWKSAFRECCKLTTLGHHFGLADEYIVLDKQRLDIWTSIGSDKPYGEWVLAGAREGKKYGEENLYDLRKLGFINDYQWLNDKFRTLYLFDPDPDLNNINHKEIL
jgi:hypothetical protein